MVTRRSFIAGLIAAPAIVRADSLMRVRGIVLPTVTWFNEDGSITVTYGQGITLSWDADGMRIA